MSKLNHTRLEMSPAALAACRKQLERRWKSRKIDDALLNRAWHTVYQIATLLYEQFGATQVAVFGSLTEPIVFTKSSDIDIAVWGLSDDAHTEANYQVMDMKTGFKIDLIHFETSTGHFRKRLQQQAIPIKKGEQYTVCQTQQNGFPIKETEIYEMNRKKLTQRINDELVKISETLARIGRGLEQIEIAPINIKEFIEKSITNDLADVYSGLERIFERIAREVDAQLPYGSRWHEELLELMTKKRPERPPVLSEKTYLLLEVLLDFRYKVKNIYGTELEYDKVEARAKVIEELFANVSQELNTFTDRLVQQAADG